MLNMYSRNILNTYILSLTVKFVKLYDTYEILYIFVKKIKLEYS